MPRKQLIDRKEARRINELSDSVYRKDLTDIMEQQRQAEKQLVSVKIDPRTTVMCRPEKVSEILQKYGV